LWLEMAKFAEVERRGDDRRAYASGMRPAPGVMLHRLSGPLNALLACGVARRARDGVIELLLDEQEAADGGMAYISMPVPVHCPVCAGRASSEPCARCRAQGTIDEPFSAWLAVRPGLADGTVLLPSAQLPGTIRPVSFRARRPADA
jgi:hypothetical protein